MSFQRYAASVINDMKSSERYQDYLCDKNPKKKYTDLNHFCYFKGVANILCTVNSETLIFLFDEFLYKDLTDSELVKRSFHENINHIKCHI